MARANFTDARFSWLSFCTTPVEILSNAGPDEVLSHGTGFFWRHDGLDWVVTCWHVLSGRNPFTGELLSTTGLVPKRIRVHGWKLGDATGNIAIQRTGYVVTLSEQAVEAFSSPPNFNGLVVDLVAIPIPPDFAIERPLAGLAYERFKGVKGYLNLQSFDKVSTQAGDTCVVTGYPLRNHTGLLLPIWKQGSLATDSNMPLDGMPCFLIDAATSSAMSGSPVLRSVKSSPIVDPETSILREARGFEMIGVYAGRLQNRELEKIDLGYAWFATLIPQAIENALPIWIAAGEEVRRALNPAGSS